MRRTAMGILIVAVAILLLSCGKSKEPDRYQDRFRVERVGYYRVITDRQTGVEYLAYAAEGGITPLYNADGTLYIANGWRDNDGL